MNSQLYITTRMMFAVARRAGAGRVRSDQRSRIPVNALAISCVGIMVSIVLSVLYPQQAFAAMMSISVYGACFTRVDDLYHAPVFSAASIGKRC